ncbi:MAG: formyltransferase family protein [Lachnospiraceae bacterium]|nr:formyltransferase family protein [Lachnospiraceae bacterium]
MHTLDKAYRAMGKEGYAVNIIIATIKSWNVENARQLQQKYAGEHNIMIMESKEELQLDMIEEFNPDYIFFPHWSYIIKKEIFDRFPCVVFHMTDLPYGRGGSPLQNLIVRGHRETKLSAIKVTGELDAGPIYGKETLSLEGSAHEIYRRASNVIFQKMIPAILRDRPLPVPQSGDITTFARRRPEESELTAQMDMSTFYDYIRMLDAEGYPHAFIRLGDKKLRFTQAVRKDGIIEAKVTIEQEESDRNCAQDCRINGIRTEK